MIIKGIIDEDFVNYKKCSMTIMCPYCSFKCDKECGNQVCQNSSLAKSESYNIANDKLVHRYIANDISESIVFQGLEPFDSYDELFDLIRKFREQTQDDIVIYTGYAEQEISNKVQTLQPFGNLIIKFGRFIPNQQNHFDNVLGVNLASDNQYAVRY